MLETRLTVEGCRVRQSGRMRCQRCHRVAFDLISVPVVPDDCVDVTMQPVVCILDVEPKVILCSNSSRILASRVLHHEIAATRDLPRYGRHGHRHNGVLARDIVGIIVVHDNADRVALRRRACQGHVPVVSDCAYCRVIIVDQANW